MENDLEIIRIGAERRDKSLIEFTQYDFYNLRLQDKIALLAYGVKNRSSEVVSELRRVLGIYLRNLIKHDFQLALESKLTKVNLLERSDISITSNFKVFSSPELGFFYNMETSYDNHHAYRIFLVSDIPKYSTSTLNWILERLDEIPEFPELKSEISFLIKERIQLRDLIRKSYSSGLTKVNSIREDDYLLSSCYDFSIHAKSQKVQYESFQVPESGRISDPVISEVNKKGKELMIEEDRVHSETDSRRIPSEAETLHNKRIEEHALTLFLEYFHPEMFMEYEQRFNYIDCWLNKDFGWKQRYSRFLQGTKQSLNLVRSNSQIVKVIDSDMRSKFNFRYAFYKVKRENGEVCIFSEADFQNVDLKDLLRVRKSLDPFSDKVARFRKTFAVLKDGIFREFIWAAKTDFQVAYVLGKEKVHLSRPNFALEGIENLKPGSVVLQPPGVIGLVNNTKLFIRLDEIHKCCNGTLLKIGEKIDKSLRRKPKRFDDAEWNNYKKLGKNFRSRIDKLLEYRRLILEDVFQLLNDWKYNLSF